jgi:hypothetical protein
LRFHLGRAGCVPGRKAGASILENAAGKILIESPKAEEGKEQWLARKN